MLVVILYISLIDWDFIYPGVGMGNVYKNAIFMPSFQAAYWFMLFLALKYIVFSLFYWKFSRQTLINRPV